MRRVVGSRCVPILSSFTLLCVMKFSVAPLSSRAVSSAIDWFDRKVNGIFIDFRLLRYIVSSLNALIQAAGFELIENPILRGILRLLVLFL